MSEQLVADLIAIVVAGVAAYLFAIPTARAWLSRRWPHAKGVVTATEVDVDKTIPGAPNAPRSIRICYRYDVDGATFDGSRYSYVTERIVRRTQPLVDEILARYPTGAPVDVRYDRRRPERAVIDVDIPWSVGIAGGASVLLIVWGLMRVARALAG